MAKILIIDDSSFSRKQMVKLVVGEGHTAVEAEDGQIGLLVVESDAPDLILCDLMMPVMDGGAFVQTARERGIDTPIWIITADVQSETKSELLEYGANLYLNKPLSTELFVTSLQENGIG